MTVRAILTFPVRGIRGCYKTAGELGYSGCKRLAVTLDIFWWRRVYHCFPDEYALFRFDRLKPFYRKEYLLRFDQYITYAKVNFPIPGNKSTQYERFEGLLGRDWMRVDPADVDSLRAFAEKHKKVLFKPTTGSCGVGIFTYEAGKDSEDVLADAVCKAVERPYLCEEYIVQHPVMAALHPNSVNTVRVLSFYDGKEVKILGATLKIGISDCVVDNIRHEGLGANIDVETGIVNTPGYDFDRKPYYFHPETGTKIIGLEIPHFDQVLAVVRQAALRVPHNTVLGWDIAVTQDGVNIIEENNRPGVRIIQMYDLQPRGREIKEFLHTSKDHVRKLTKREKEYLKRRY